MFKSKTSCFKSLSFSFTAPCTSIPILPLLFLPLSSRLTPLTDFPSFGDKFASRKRILKKYAPTAKSAIRKKAIKILVLFHDSSFFTSSICYNGSMNLKSLQEKIKLLNEKTRPQYKLYSPIEKEILTKTVKLNEEVGELCNDILSILKLQNFDKRNMYEEFADVIITAMQLAIAAGVDVERAVGDKLKKIEGRYMKDKS